MSNAAFRSPENGKKPAGSTEVEPAGQTEAGIRP